MSRSAPNNPKRGLEVGLIRACPNESVNGCILPDGHTGGCVARERVPS